MRILLLITTFYFSICLAKTESYFSPHQGNLAFEKIYQNIEMAKKHVHATIYSWSDTTLDKYLFSALKRDVKVKIVLHPPLYNDDVNLQTRVAKLEKAGAQIKIADMQMHEKFFIFDDLSLVNSSANMSGGAKKRYSENFIFFSFSKNDSAEEQKLTQDTIKIFRQEFSVLFDSAKDIITHNEGISEQLKDYPIDSTYPISITPIKSSISLNSSSMNFEYNINTQAEINKTGQYLKKKKINYSGTGTQIWTIKDEIIKNIRQAKSNILVNMNHFFLADIREELIKAAKKGIEIKMVVDNQEYKDGPTGKTETPRFVKEWKEIPGNENLEPPVRVKFYSIAPNPAFWLLNHHKYLLIDYSTNVETDKTVLITGSYNLSITAEHFQYDNMLIIRGSIHKNLFDSYYSEFENLWGQNRFNNDSLNTKITDYFINTNNQGLLPLHNYQPISLEWSELKKLRSQIRNKFPGYLETSFSNSNCQYYLPSDKTYKECIEQ